MRRVVFIAGLLFIVFIGYGQKSSFSDYQDLVRIVKSGDTTVISQSLGRRDVNLVEDRFEVPLIFYACSEGNEGMVKFLLSKGANSNIPSVYGTAAHWAIEKGHMNIIRILLDHGFNPRTEEMQYWVDRYESGDSLSPAWMPKLIESLYKHKVDYQNAPYMEYVDPSDPLLLAAAITNTESDDFILAKELIEDGLNVNLRDKRGLSALHYAILSLNIKAVSLLIDSGADVNLPIYSRKLSELSSNIIFDDNLTPLHFLMYQLKGKSEILETKRDQVLKIIKLLMRAGADVTLKTKNKQQSVLDVAKEIGDKKIVKLLK
ncbi:ankyrin repeat domain-containing protein [Ancylomarina salipaludis]|nr:ankyrin repeat domain-containing protein [Ancylomarina salipaludis]